MVPDLQPVVRFPCTAHVRHSAAHVCRFLRHDGERGTREEANDCPLWDLSLSHVRAGRKKKFCGVAVNHGSPKDSNYSYSIKPYDKIPESHLRILIPVGAWQSDLSMTRMTSNAKRSLTSVALQYLLKWVEYREHLHTTKVYPTQLTRRVRG
jgi:hypothetical protein